MCTLYIVEYSYVSIGKVFSIGAFFLYKSACDTCADNNLLGGGQGDDDDNDIGIDGVGGFGNVGGGGSGDCGGGSCDGGGSSDDGVGCVGSVLVVMVELLVV